MTLRQRSVRKRQFRLRRVAHMSRKNIQGQPSHYGWHALLLVMLGLHGLLGAPAGAACTPAPSGLTSWWPAAGNANDVIGSSPGSLQNGATFGVGKVGQAFSLDG